ncbi:hypothetical protein GCM10011363_29840 [Marivita lacus]|jgi:hypothetical protein|uniref:Uncharacterized protein n=1 Tax=Marivita lacus TaxID=1323742 RepID=A0ABQ1KYN1_9RHOB|nr:hypothetical protein [Marivita lacus]GGC11214.1 hypothetical protein GCM10011363_29840 [Marivita lacus]
MNTLRPNIETIEKTLFLVTSYIFSRLFRRDLQGELERLQCQSKRRSFAEIALTMAAIFGLALFAASFGWLGLGVYFFAVIVLFH